MKCINRLFSNDSQFTNNNENFFISSIWNVIHNCIPAWYQNLNNWKSRHRVQFDCCWFLCSVKILSDKWSILLHIAKNIGNFCYPLIMDSVFDQEVFFPILYFWPLSSRKCVKVWEEKLIWERWESINTKKVWTLQT